MSVFQPGQVSYGLTQPLIGVPNPPIISQRAPTVDDKANLGTFWINQATNLPYIITSIVDNIATWVPISSAGSVTQIVTDSGTAVPIAGSINLFGGANIETSASANTIDVAVTPIIDLPATNAAQTQGIYRIGGVNALFLYPPTSTFVGNAGNTTSNSLLAVHNVGVGNQALASVTTGNSNTALGASSLINNTTGLNNVAVGYLSMAAVTTGDTNLALGNQSLQNFTTGNDNIAIGFASGSSYTGAESSNILINNSGTMGENNVIRIGDQGSGAGQQDICYIAGVYGVVPGATNEVMFADNTGKLGSSKGTDGQIIIGSTAVSPAWANITPGTNVVIINGSNSIEVSVPTIGAETFDGDTGSATGNPITLAGGHNMTTAAGGSTVTFNVSGTTQHSLLLGNATGSINSLGVATNGELAIGSTGADPVLAPLTAGSGISITNGAGSITVASTISQGIVTIDGNSGSVTGTTVPIVGGNNITTSGSATTLTVEVSGTTQHSLLLGNATGSINDLGVATNGEIPIGSTGADPVLATITAGSGISVTNGAGSITVANTQTQGIVTIDGNSGSVTGTTVTIEGGNNITTSGSATTLTVGVSGTTQYSLLLGNSTGSINNLGVATNGQIPIGSTGANPVLATLTAGANITITNGAGSITIAASGGGGGITTIDGDTGSATGATVTFTTSSDCGSTVLFNALAAQVDFIITDGNSNILMGEGSGNNTGTGSQNTCLGRSCLVNYTTATGNTAVGYNALFDVNATNYNAAVGDSALSTLATGSGGNAALGASALTQLATGSNNIAIGYQAGENYTGAESNNILIGNQGTTSESDTIRIGDGSTQTSFYTTGVFGATVSAGSGTAVFVDNTGRLGTVLSSRRYKEGVQSMGLVSSSVLELRPVIFRYKNDPTGERRFGLIAEEVDEIMPDLVIYNKSGDPETVKYHDLPVLLLNELQKQHNVIADLSRRLHRLEERMRYESTR